MKKKERGNYEFKYVICSRDKDYLAPIEFWKNEVDVDICTRSIIPNEDKTIEDGQKACSADEKIKANTRIMGSSLRIGTF